MLIFRMHDPIWDVFDTGGALKHRGRWHSAGTPVIYAAEHISLAALELLVHAGGKRIPPRVVTTVEVPSDLLIENCEWRDEPESRRIGDEWVREGRSVLLKVPSIAADRMESNFVINPAHPQFAGIKVIESRPFHFDPRFIHTI
jgi:RES domain-containing protein